jgi:hypothetical protein
MCCYSAAKSRSGELFWRHLSARQRSSYCDDQPHAVLKAFATGCVLVCVGLMAVCRLVTRDAVRLAA